MKISIFGLLLYCMMMGVSAAQSSNDSTVITDSETINIYLDCSQCDNDFIRTEIDFVNYVRDRKQSDLHLLVTTRPTGSGGQEYTLTFIGQKDFKGRSDTLVFVTAETDSDDKIRNRFVKIMKLGLVPYLTGLPVADEIDIKYVKPEAKTEVKDTWNHWVFSLSVNGWVDGEESYNSLWQNTNIEVNRVTEDIKLEFGLYNNYNEQNFDYGTVTHKYVSRSHGHYGYVVPSLTDHWSWAFSWDIYSSSYRFNCIV